MGPSLPSLTSPIADLVHPSVVRDSSNGLLLSCWMCLSLCQHALDLSTLMPISVMTFWPIVKFDPSKFVYFVCDISTAVLVCAKFHCDLLTHLYESNDNFHQFIWNTVIHTDVVPMKIISHDLMNKKCLYCFLKYTLVKALCYIFSGKGRHAILMGLTKW